MVEGNCDCDNSDKDCDSCQQVQYMMRFIPFKFMFFEFLLF